MSDAVFFVVVGLLAAGAVALALVWPQGLGSPSPAPFGHPVAVQGEAGVDPPAPGSAPAPRATPLKGSL